MTAWGAGTRTGMDKVISQRRGQIRRKGHGHLSREWIDKRYRPFGSMLGTEELFGQGVTPRPSRGNGGQPRATRGATEGSGGQRTATEGNGGQRRAAATDGVTACKRGNSNKGSIAAKGSNRGKVHTCEGPPPEGSPARHNHKWQLQGERGSGVKKLPEGRPRSQLRQTLRQPNSQAIRRPPSRPPISRRRPALALAPFADAPCT